MGARSSGTACSATFWFRASAPLDPADRRRPLGRGLEGLAQAFGDGLDPPEHRADLGEQGEPLLGQVIRCSAGRR